MSIKIYHNTKVYVAVPANIATGGPELLHQLVFHLRNDLDIKAYMYYIPNNIPDPIHSEYKQYNNPFVREVEDKELNILIVPEIISNMKILSEYSKIRQGIWWLSVDNFYLSIVLSSKRVFFFRKTINKISKMIFSRIIFDINELALERINSLSLKETNLPLVKRANYHLAQSYYAMNYLRNINIPENKIFYLSDYLNKNFLKIQTDLSKKENIIAYNPKKGFSFTRKIIKASPDIKFIPLINMTRQQVIKTLQRTKVYIDFGNHPGKDRIPREAAILGCCVITGKRGSARYLEDVSVPEKYKFEDKISNIPFIVDRIKDCFNNYENKIKDFNYYREIIRQEPERFKEDLKKIFVKIQ